MWHACDLQREWQWELEHSAEESLGPPTLADLLASLPGFQIPAHPTACAPARTGGHVEMWTVA